MSTHGLVASNEPTPPKRVRAQNAFKCAVRHPTQTGRLWTVDFTSVVFATPMAVVVIHEPKQKRHDKTKYVSGEETRRASERLIK